MATNRSGGPAANNIVLDANRIITTTRISVLLTCCSSGLPPAEIQSSLMIHQTEVVIGIGIPRPIDLGQEMPTMWNSPCTGLQTVPCARALPEKPQQELRRARKPCLLCDGPEAGATESRVAAAHELRVVSGVQHLEADLRLQRAPERQKLRQHDVVVRSERAANPWIRSLPCSECEGRGRRVRRRVDVVEDPMDS